MHQIVKTALGQLSTQVERCKANNWYRSIPELTKKRNKILKRWPNAHNTN